jgi:hypothetical protein
VLRNASRGASDRGASVGRLDGRLVRLLVSHARAETLGDRSRKVEAPRGGCDRRPARDRPATRCDGAAESRATR